MGDRRSWSTTTSTQPDVPTDQFQPTIAAGPNGAVAVAFYDRRESLPERHEHPARRRGRTNFCIDTSLQAYKDSGSGAVPVAANVRISQFTWDPEQPGQHLGGLSQYPCAGATDPCQAGAGFIGDYFGLAISDHNIYALSVSTHYPSGVTADEGGLDLLPAAGAGHGATRRLRHGLLIRRLGRRLRARPWLQRSPVREGPT